MVIYHPQYFSIDLFASIQGIISTTMLVTLLVIGFAGLTITGSLGMTTMQVMESLKQSGTSVYSLVLVALWLR